MSDDEFVNSSVLEILIPQASDLDIEDILQTAEDTDAASIIPSIQQRELLFFDESLPLYAVLRTTSKDEKSLRNRLSRVTINLEAHAVSSQPSQQSRDRAPPGQQVRDVVWTGKVDVTEDPTTMVIGAEEDSQILLLVWKTTVILGRPRIRLQAPAILFKVSASLQPALLEQVREVDPYLPSGVPLPSNILQPLGTDAALKTVLPQLSATRLIRKAPRNLGVKQEILPIKVAARRACRAVPALSSRIRVQKAPFSKSTPAMIGALEIDVPPFSQYPLDVMGVTVSLPQGRVQQIGEGVVPRFPATLHAKDQIVCLYNLTQDAQATASGQGIQTLEVLISVTVTVSDECHPQIQVRFKANVDFLGTAPKPAPPPNQRTNKPSQDAMISVKPADQFVDTTDYNSTTQEKLGIIIKFTARGDIYVGEPFKWDVFVMNRSGRPRRLGLSMLHKRKPASEKRISSRPTSISQTRSPIGVSVADAFVDDNLLYTMMRTHNRDVTQLICLDTDVKIGPLNPSSCYSTDMEFLALAPGMLHIDAIRLTDYTTNEAVDIRDLPDILALERRHLR